MTIRPKADSADTASLGAPRPDRITFLNPFDDPVLLSYFASLRAWHGYIRFLGLPHLRDNPDVPIQRLYVEPLLSSTYVSPHTNEPDTAGSTPVTEVLSTTPRVILLGDPGSGKSTLVSWITWQLSRPEDNPWTTELGSLVPLPIVLRELRVDEQITWDTLLDGFLNHPVTAALRAHRGQLAEILQRGQAIIMLDGLDEIGSLPARRSLQQAVLEGVTRYPLCRWLVTTRIVGYEQVPFHTLMPNEPHDGQDPERGVDWARRFYVAPFSDRQIELFAQNWYAQHESVESLRVERSRSLVAAVRQHESIRRLARVPNLLTLMALVHRIQAKLPHGRALLYNKIAEAYLESIDEFRGIREAGYTLAQKKRWLASVGFRMQLRRSNNNDAVDTPDILVDQGDLQEWVQQAMASVVSPEAAATEAASFIDYIGRRSGLLLPRGEGRFAFTHLSFQEYFAACHLAEWIGSPHWLAGRRIPEGTAPANLRRYVDDVSWREVLVLLFEVLNDRQGWADEVASVMFDDCFAAFDADPGCVRSTAVQVVAEVAADPHSGLSPEVRRQAWDACWFWELRRQQLPGVFFPGGNAVARALLNAPTADLANILDSFASAAAAVNAKSFDFTGCDSISDLEPLKRVTTLEQLRLTGCVGISDLAPLARLQNLRELRLDRLPLVSDLTPLSTLRLTRLDLDQSASINDVRALSSMSELRRLVLERTGVADISPLAGLRALEELNLNGTLVADLTPVKRMRKLRVLELRRAPVGDLSPVTSLDGLRELTITCHPGTDLSPLRELKRLEVLNVGNLTTDASPISHLLNLRDLFLVRTTVDDLRRVLSSRKLERLSLAHSPLLRDIGLLSTIDTLEYLDLEGCSGIENIRALAGLQNLRTVDLSGTSVTDLTPLVLGGALKRLVVPGPDVVIPDELRAVSYTNFFSPAPLG